MSEECLDCPHYGSTPLSLYQAENSAVETDWLSSAKFRYLMIYESVDLVMIHIAVEMALACNGVWRSYVENGLVYMNASSR